MLPDKASAHPAATGTASPGNTKPQLGPSPSDSFKGWHSRGYLPHYDALRQIQSITFRLADSLPQQKLRQIEEELAHTPEKAYHAERRKKMDEWLDAGMGCCALRHFRLASVMQETLQQFDGHRYRLIAWCIMSNHVHVLIEPTISLARIVQSWKSFTGRWAIAHNAELGLGVPGKHLWMREYWDRFIRNEEHFQQTVYYIHRNPVKAGICKQPEDWPWSSAYPGNARHQHEPSLSSSVHPGSGRSSG